MNAACHRPAYFPATLLALLLASCGPDEPSAELAAQEREIIELNLRLDLLQYRLETRMPAAQSGSSRELDLKLDELARNKEALARTSAMLREEIMDLDRAFEDFRTESLVKSRRNAIGREFDRMTSRDGRVFEQVKITGVDDGGVRIRHRSGTATLRYAHLNDEQRVAFGMDEQLALMAEQRERSETQAWHSWIENEAENLASRHNASSEYDDSPARDRSLAADVPARRTSPLAEPARPFGSSPRYRPSSYRTRYRSVYYYTPYTTYSPARSCPQPYQHYQQPIRPIRP